MKPIPAVCLCFAMCVAALAGPPRAIAQIQSSTSRWDDLPSAPRPKARSETRDALYWTAKGLLAGGTWFDATTTVSGLDRPSMAYRENGTFLMRYTITEGGWARCFSTTDGVTVATANVIMNAGVAELSERLYRRGGRWWRFAAIALDASKGLSSAMDGFHNVGVQANVDKQVARYTGYRGQIIWRRR